MNLRPDRIAHVRGPQRRGAIEERRYRFPCQPLIGKLVRFLRRPERWLRLEVDAEQLTGERRCGVAFTAVDIEPGETLAQEIVGNDLAVAIDRGARLVDRRGTFRVPTRALLPRVLHAHRLAELDGDEGCVGSGIAGVVAAIGAGTAHPDRTHSIRRNIENARYAVSHPMRFL